MSKYKSRPSKAHSALTLPSPKMQWAFFGVVIFFTCMILVIPIAMFLLYGSFWCLTPVPMGFPLGGLWAQMARHLFPIEIKEHECD